MSQRKFSHSMPLKVLIVANLIAFGLSRVANADEHDSKDAVTMSSSHSPPVQQGNDFNYMNGGGG